MAYCKCPDPEIQPYFQREDELSDQDDCVLRGNRIVVPPQGRSQVVDELHETYLPGNLQDEKPGKDLFMVAKHGQYLGNKVRICNQCQVY